MNDKRLQSLLKSSYHNHLVVYLKIHMRIPSLLDALITEVDTAIRTLLPPPQRIPNRCSPTKDINESPLTSQEKKHIAGLMRVNHAGEVCAQALYQGQALTAQLTHIRKQMSEAAEEEIDHLAWCEERLYQLGSKPSILNPFWYAGSIGLGIIAGLAGDKISLGFVAETERQVTRHLQQHIHRIPDIDHKTKAILEQMQQDEEHHAHTAMEAGGVELPTPIKQLMSLVSKLMTKSSYYL